jgi:ribosomal protein S6E (S10)
MMNASYTYEVARADFEKKRAGVTLKLLLGAELDSEWYEVEFNQSGGLIVTDKHGTPMERKVIGEGDSRPAFIR